MDYLKKMQAIEKSAGNKTKAAMLAGVTLNTWSRWANQRVDPSGSRSIKIIDLLFDQLSTSNAEEESNANG